MNDDFVNYNYRELLDALNEQKDLILTVPADQVETLKKGLHVRKGKDNYALKKRGMLPSVETLDFLVYAAKDAEGKEIPNVSCVRVKLKERKSIAIYKMEIPDPSI